MSGSVNTLDDGTEYARLGLSNPGSELLSLLSCDAIVPGSAPSYQLAKTIYLFHPLGAKMAETPVKMARSKPRKISVPVGAAEDRLIEAFVTERKVMRADTSIVNAIVTSRVYGISSLVIGARGVPANKPLDPTKLYEYDMFYNVLDPLNTAGSLVLDQDPNSPDFQKPVSVAVAGTTYHPSRAIVMMNEEPVYISFTSSAFGFVGRSVYQRALFPLRTFVQSMITDDMVTKKVGLLIWNAKAPGSIMNNRILNFFGMKRRQQ